MALSFMAARAAEAAATKDCGVLVSTSPRQRAITGASRQHYLYGDTKRQTDIQKGRQTDRQTDRQTYTLHAMQRRTYADLIFANINRLCCYFYFLLLFVVSSSLSSSSSSSSSSFSSSSSC